MGAASAAMLHCKCCVTLLVAYEEFADESIAAEAAPTNKAYILLSNLLHPIDSPHRAAHLAASFAVRSDILSPQSHSRSFSGSAAEFAGHRTDMNLFAGSDVLGNLDFDAG